MSVPRLWEQEGQSTVGKAVREGFLEEVKCGRGLEGWGRISFHNKAFLFHERIVHSLLRKLENMQSTKRREIPSVIH